MVPTTRVAVLGGMPNVLAHAGRTSAQPSTLLVDVPDVRAAGTLGREADEWALTDVGRRGSLKAEPRQRPMESGVGAQALHIDARLLQGLMGGN